MRPYYHAEITHSSFRNGLLTNFRIVVPAAEEAIQGQSRRLKQGLRQLIKGKPAELGKGVWFGQPGFLVSNVRQELEVDVVLFVGQDIGDTKELEVGHLHSQLLQGFSPGALLQGFTPFQVSTGGSPVSPPWDPWRLARKTWPRRTSTTPTPTRGLESSVVTSRVYHGGSASKRSLTRGNQRRLGCCWAPPRARLSAGSRRESQIPSR